ncbi:SWIM-type domain-containing protein [Trichonephila inaurata madagascariensis]|uniref:SWIM-type domain-containing protein n=1 Tax=Trichonephila inaurata madagascariensis TaxID=2747483 RepID=A0A8X7CMY6_9ARAC|nr:SWIM-type domain-containing protein [Trichonephila inaurata madagascariensis]
MDSEPLGEVGTPLQLDDKIRFRACALPPYHIAVVCKRDKMEFEQEIVQKNCFVSQLQEFYPYCIEDTDKSTPEKIVLRINLENEEEAENFKNNYSVVSNTTWIVYGCTPNPQCTTIKVHEDHLWAVLLVTPLMKRNHHLSSSKEIIFINSTSSCEASSSTITSYYQRKNWALALVMIHASQSIHNYINAFQLLKMNFPQCFGRQDYPEVFMSDDSSAEKGALAAVWPEAKQLLCHFHVAQAEPTPKSYFFCSLN